MNKIPLQAESDMLAAVLDAVRGFGLDASLEAPLKADRMDASKPSLILRGKLSEPAPQSGKIDDPARLRIGRGSTDVVYQAAVQRHLSPATLGIALHQLERLKPPALLVCDYITPPLADELRRRRVAFLDAAGNAYIDQPNLLVWVTGRKRAAKPVAQQPMGRAFQPTGLQVVFALLCDPQWARLPYRDLAAKAGVAHGTVGEVMLDLQRLGFVADIQGKRGTRRLFQGERLLAQWVDAYARQLRPRMLLGRYYLPTLEGWQDWPVAAHGAQWGGEPAGAMLTNYLRPGELTLYADKVPGALAARYRFNKEAAIGQQAVVEVRRRFWRFSSEGMLETLVPPVLIYADLLATGDARCIETASLIYEDPIARLVRQA